MKLNWFYCQIPKVGWHCVKFKQMISAFLSFIFTPFKFAKRFLNTTFDYSV